MDQPQRHPLRGLLVAQFFGAFNDNAWKLIVALLAIRQIGLEMTPGPAFEAGSQVQTTLTFVVFTLPLMLVSVFAGVSADRLSKRTVIILLKGVEVGLMAMGTVALLIDPSGLLLPLIVLAFMGVQSALFSPAKYGILPEILPHERLSSGNGLLEMWTFLAIIAGMGVAGLLLDVSGHSPWLAGLALTTFAVFGFGAALAVPNVAAARSEGGLVYTVKGAWAALRSDPVLRLAILGAISFWTLASLVGQDILIYAKAGLHLSDTKASLPLAVLALGIGAGAVAAGRLSASKVEYGLIPLGTSGLAVCLFLTGLLTP